MPKRRVPSDEEDEVSDKAQQIASEEEVVKKSKKSTEKSEKVKASVALMHDSYRPIAVLTFALRHNLARNRRRGKKLPQTERSRLTKKGKNTLIWGATGEQRFASSKARHCAGHGSTK